MLKLLIFSLIATIFVLGCFGQVRMIGDTTKVMITGPSMTEDGSDERIGVSNFSL